MNSFLLYPYKLIGVFIPICLLPLIGQIVEWMQMKFTKQSVKTSDSWRSYLSKLKLRVSSKYFTARRPGPQEQPKSGYLIQNWLPRVSLLSVLYREWQVHEGATDCVETREDGDAPLSVSPQVRDSLSPTCRLVFRSIHMMVYAAEGLTGFCSRMFLLISSSYEFF